MRLPRDPVFYFPDEPPERPGGDGGGVIFIGVLCVVVAVTYLLLNL